MRDNLCDSQKLSKIIEFNLQCLREDRQSIEQLKIDMQNSVQRFPNSNESIVSSEYAEIFKLNKEIICALYSSGENPSLLIPYYLDALQALSKTEANVGYVNVLWMISLGILLEVDIAYLSPLNEVVKKGNINDILMSFFLYACGLAGNTAVTGYEKEIPYQSTFEIITLASKDRAKASARLAKYMNKEWFVGHYDYEWKNAHKRHGYVGIWSFDTAALVKILKIDDSTLLGNIHYPYDLAHFKNELTLKIGDISKSFSKTVEKLRVGIRNSPQLEAIIPPKYHALVDQVIKDYNELSNSDFWYKYELKSVWNCVEDYIKENEEKKLLGTIIVFILVQNQVILQIDFKEDVSDYIDSLYNGWNTSKVKIVSLTLNNDQNYYMYVSQTSHEAELFEVSIYDTIL